MSSCKNTKTDYIRKLLLKTVGKNQDLFCYYVAIQEAKRLLGQSSLEVGSEFQGNVNKDLKELAEG